MKKYRVNVNGTVYEVELEEITGAAPAAPAAKAFAPGSAGEVKLHDVPDRTAAMLMAIVADKMGKPLNELRFLSIREIK